MNAMIVILAALMCLAAPKENLRPGTAREVGQETVIVGRGFGPGILYEVRDLKFYACRLKRNDAPCTLITGVLFSNAPHQNYVVAIDIDFYETYTNARFIGTARIEVDRPLPGKPVKFEGIGPAWWTAQANGTDKRPIAAYHEIRVTQKVYSPPAVPTAKPE